jgi:hypothetical protein
MVGHWDSVHVGVEVVVERDCDGRPVGKADSVIIESLLSNIKQLKKTFCQEAKTNLRKTLISLMRDNRRRKGLVSHSR